MQHNLTSEELELIRKHIQEVNDSTLPVSDAYVYAYIADSTGKEVQELIEYLKDKPGN